MIVLGEKQVCMLLQALELLFSNSQFPLIIDQVLLLWLSTQGLPLDTLRELLDAAVLKELCSTASGGK